MVVICNIITIVFGGGCKMIIRVSWIGRVLIVGVRIGFKLLLQFQANLRKLTSS